MILYQVLHFTEELVKHLWGSSNDVRFITVASRQVLRRDDRHLIPTLGANEQNLGMVVSEEGRRNHLIYEAPQRQRLVGSFEVKHQVNCGCTAIPCDEVQPP